jgi:hypothetical protein
VRPLHARNWVVLPGSMGRVRATVRAFFDCQTSTEDGDDTRTGMYLSSCTVLDTRDFYIVLTDAEYNATECSPSTGTGRFCSHGIFESIRIEFEVD